MGELELGNEGREGREGREPRDPREPKELCGPFMSKMSGTLRERGERGGDGEGGWSEGVHVIVN